MMYYTNSKMLKELALHRNRGEKAFIKMIINSGLIQINHSILYYLSQKFTVKNLLSMNKISTNSLLSVKHAILALAFIVSASQFSHAQVLPPTSGPCPGGNAIGGTAYMDMNFDGTDDATGGFAGVFVYLYDNCSATPDIPLDSVLTDSNGEYFFNQPVGNYRIEFGLKGECDHLVFGPVGASGGSDVQFVTAPGCSFDVGVADPAKYCQVNPALVTSCFVSGDPSAPGKPQDALITWASNLSGTVGAKTSLSNAAFLGTLWGIAYAKSTKTLYTSPVLKTHAGLGSGGLDVIYSVDPNTSIAFEWIDLGDLGIQVSDFGTGLNDGQFPTNTARGLNVEPQYDAQAHTRIGKVGIGDLEISDDEKTLYFVNLHNKSLYAIDISTKTIVSGFPLVIPTPTCTGGTNRPFALGKDEGRIYVGTLCDASSSGASPISATNDTGVNNLTATVYRLNGLTFQQVLGPFSLAYEREPMDAYNGTINTTIDNWFPWVDNAVLAPNGFGPSGSTAYPTPLFTDIEFADNDNLILGFSDRTGLQLGFQNYGVSPSTALQSAVAGGDILHACKATATATSKNNTWNIEGAGCTSSGGHALGTNTSSYTDAGWTPTNGGNPVGEYYTGDFFHSSGTTTNPMGRPGHGEIVNGGLALIPKSGQVIATAFDPVTGAANFNTGGIIKLDNITGQRAGNGFQIYDDTDIATAGKGVGLGDLEAMCEVPPFQIGSYVWEDTDNDGIQDPCLEMPIVGLMVSIYDTSDLINPIATTTTGPDGSYYFDNGDIDPATPYYIVFGNGTSPTVEDGAGTTYVATTPNTGEGLSPDNNDSDATSDPGLFNGAPFILFTSPVSGSNFSFDLGLLACPYIQNPSAAQNICEGTVGENMTVEVGVNDPNLIKFVVFTTDQMAGASPTLTEAAAIYAGTMIGMPVTPTGGAEPYLATLTSATANWANMAPGTYYVYGILNVGASDVCMPAAEIVITIAERPSILAADYIICESGPGAGAVIDLSTIVQNPDGATLTFTDLASSPYNTPHNFAAGGPYSVDVIASNPAVPGCESRDTFIVEVLPFPELVVINDTICRGSSVDLNTLVVSHTGDDLEFYTTLIDAQNGTNELFLVNVTPTISTNYFVKSVLDPTISGCEAISKVTVFLRSANCYPIGVSVP